MNCDTLQRAIDERRPGDTAVLPGDLAAHLAGCPACQAYAAGVAAIGHALAHCRDMAASLPEAELLAARERIAGAVAARRDATVRRQPISRAPADPLLVWGTGLAVLLLAALIGVLAWPRRPVAGTPNAQRSTPNAQVGTEHPSASSVERSAFNVPPPDPAGGQLAATPQPPAPESTKIATEIEEPQLTGLPAFRAEYEALKASGKGIAPGFLQRFACYLEGASRTLDERLQGWELLCEACEEAGELNRSVQAYGKYLESLAQRDGRDVASRMGRQRAVVVMRRDRDKIRGLALMDMVATVFPGPDTHAWARSMEGDHYFTIRRWAEAAEAYRETFETAPVGNLRATARSRFAITMSLAGKTHEAIAYIDAYAVKTDRMEDAAYADNMAASLLYGLGPRHYHEATVRLRRVVRTYPGSTAATDATNLLAMINSKMTAGMLADPEMM